MWTLSAPPDKLIAIRFICDFEIEAEIKGNNILCYDLLTIEGKLTPVKIMENYTCLETGHPARLFCGSKKPEKFIKSRTNEVQIRFQTDFNDTRTGFTIEYQVWQSQLTTVPSKNWLSFYLTKLLRSCLRILQAVLLHLTYY